MITTYPSKPVIYIYLNIFYLIFIILKDNDPYGKKFYNNMPVEDDDAFNVSLITPVIHYTMGGLKVDELARVLGK